MGDDHATDVLARGVLIDHRNELIEVRQSNRGRVELAKLHYLGVDFSGKVRAGDCGNQGTIGHGGARDRAAGGDQSKSGHALKVKEISAHAAGAARKKLVQL